MYLIIFILNNPDQCKDVLNAWEEVGITGITILESSGVGRVRQAGRLDDMPLMPGLIDLLKSDETSHRTFLSVVKDQETIDAVLKVTREVVGDLENGHTGFLFVLPVLQAYGMSRKSE